jgi:hypothetical protein
MKTKYYFLLLVITLILPAYPQSSKINLTGNLYADSKMLLEKNNVEPLPQLTFQTANKKSPLLAGVLSFVLPGAGEFYNGEYLRTAIFVALEAAVITTAVIYDNKGDNQTDTFQKFADKNWSIVKYAEYLNRQQTDETKHIDINSDESLPPWERVNWAQLNEAERAGNGTHTLPPHGTQQYYELIGKYHEYIPGWTGDDNITNPPQIMLNYSKMRGQANDYYGVASTAVIGIYINHFLSILDAVWVTVSHNKSLAIKMRMEKNYYADRLELVPTLKFSLSF